MSSFNIDVFPLIQTKLYRPRIPSDFVNRTRLFDQLDCSQGNPLTLVAAPAGYGKSTLLASWLEGVNQHVLDQLERTKLLDMIGEENIFLGQPKFGAALREALAAAEEWMAQNKGDS